MTQKVQRRKVKDATKPLTFIIKEEHREIAKCGDASNCMVAVAIKDNIGEILEGIEIGMRISKVFTDSLIVRYATPSKLTRALPIFDKTGCWDLPPGEYTLLPVPADRKLGAPRCKGRGTGKPHGDKTEDKFKGRPIPTRRLSHLNRLISEE